MTDLGLAEAGCPVFDDESCDPLISFCLVGLGEDDTVIRYGRIRDPALVSVQDPFITVLDGRRLDGGGIAAGIGLDGGQASDLLARHEIGDEFLFLLFGSSDKQGHDLQ